MASEPSFDPSTIDEDWQSLSSSQDSPLLNRAVQGAYPPGSALGPFLLAASQMDGVEPTLPAELSFALNGRRYECARQPQDDESWNELIEAGCPGALAQLGLSLGGDRLMELFSDLGFYSAPALPLETHAQAAPTSLDRPEAAATGQDDLRVSPLQLAMAACTLSNYGKLVAAQITLAAEQPDGTLEELTQPSSPVEVFNRSAAVSTMQSLAVANLPIWELTGQALDEEGKTITWYLAGALSGFTGDETGRCIVILLESDQPALARSIGRELLLSAIE
ncbi:MAG: penicillin-binding transpeptidase domain-containing protein [Chloroflexi bacterium]|nr:penicillin-binding transpeptidase domain-containing protein [Chloroflexota bacterium]